MDRQTINALQLSEIRTFVRTTFGLRGTLQLHRSAIGADLLRAPANVLLAPLLFVVKLGGLLAKMLRLHGTARWLSNRRILLQTNVSKEVAVRVKAFVGQLHMKGLIVAVPDDILDREITNYTGVRSAVGEITTTILIVIAGITLFQAVTPGLISLTGPVAEMRAHMLAVDGFPLGQRLGRAYYGVFSIGLETWQVVLTGIILAMIASVVTTFAGLIADPVQVMTATHRRRLSRLLRRLEVNQGHSSGLATEHITARFADLSDIVLNLWRMIRG